MRVDRHPARRFNHPYIFFKKIAVGVLTKGCRCCIFALQSAITHENIPHTIPCNHFRCAVCRRATVFYRRFFQTDASARAVASMNPVWQFHKGDAPGAQAPDFDDSKWAVVSLPHGVDALPEASGCVNYQGVAWYRKHFHSR